MHVLVYLYIIVSCLEFNVTFSQGQASGNAMDLQKMNMNLMNAMCPIQPCQSACLTRNENTNCYVCSSACSPGGSNTGIMVKPLQSVFGGVGNQGPLYSGCESNWMACPIQCTRGFTLKGCVQCHCPTERTTSKDSTIASSTAVNQITSTTPVTQHDTSTQVSSIATRQISRMSSVLPSVSTADPSTILMITSKKSTPKNVPLLTTRSREYDNGNDVKTTLSVFLENRNGEIATQSRTTIQALNQHNLKDSDSKPNDKIEYLAFVFSLSTLSLFSLVLSIVSFIAWRKSKQNLRKNKDELYFVHKAYRQDSKAILSNNDMLEPVYAHVNLRPEIPPRSPPHTPLSPTAPVTSFSFRTESSSSDTSVQHPTEDMRHDYLELI